ncbi:MAG: FAD-dependent oxidoreductase [Candidatus Bathyarchaeota archaeon]|nr:FAD-dependent oxidoreductase [Candidatus Bathyarchaeota archaeon]
MEHWDLIIVGAGPAGLAAGIYGARSGLRTLLLDEKIAGGTAVEAPLVENYLGFPSIKGSELAEKMVLHCKQTGAVIHDLEAVSSLELEGEKKIVKTSVSEYSAGAVIIATGSSYKQLGVKGENEFRGKGVSYCGVCDGFFFKGKHVLVIGGGNSACATSLYLSGLASHVTVVHRRAAFRGEKALVKDLTSKTNTTVLFDTTVKEIKGDKTVNTVTLSDLKTGETRDISVDGVFVQIGEAPNSQLAQDSGIQVNESTHIIIDIKQQTSIPGVYAAGDVTSHPIMQIGTAVGQGITAALQAYSYLKRPYYRK